MTCYRQVVFLFMIVRYNEEGFYEKRISKPVSDDQ